MPVVNGRPFEDFFTLFASAVSGDLTNQMDFWQEVAHLASGPPITPLRALDIVAWHLGGRRQ